MLEVLDDEHDLGPRLALRGAIRLRDDPAFRVSFRPEL